jgi:hypothetical protein
MRAKEGYAGCREKRITAAARMAMSVAAPGGENEQGRVRVGAGIKGLGSVKKVRSRFFFLTLEHATNIIL